MRVALLVPAGDFDEPWRWAFDAEAGALRSAGIEVDSLRWTEPFDPNGHDLLLPLVAWGYHLRFAQWLALLDRLEAARAPLLNPVPLLRWNSDKAYLEALGSAGIAAVPSLAVERLDPAQLDRAADAFATRDLVVKPRISAGGTGTYRIAPGVPIPDDVRDLPMIVQPMLGSIRDEGEYSLILFDGRLSHCVVKRPASGDFRVQPHFGGTTIACDPPKGGEALALAALDAAPAESLYARVDMVRDGDGRLAIMELELVEPALFLDQAPGSGERFARSVLAAANRLVEQPLA